LSSTKDRISERREEISDNPGKRKDASGVIGTLSKDVYLYLRDVKRGFFSPKYDWLFLNDRIIFINISKIGRYHLPKSVITKYSDSIGDAAAATALLKRLQSLRRRKACSILVEDIENLLRADGSNFGLKYSDMSRVRLQKKFFGDYNLTIVSKQRVEKVSVLLDKVFFKSLVFFMKARVGSRFVED
jgi:hypothetical protein